VEERTHMTASHYAVMWVRTILNEHATSIFRIKVSWLMILLCGSTGWLARVMGSEGEMGANLIQ
jgi:hypothetical protein